MAEGAASREGSAPPDAAGSEDDPRVGPDATSGDCVAAAPGGRWRDRRSGVALPGAAGPPADSEAALLEAARATPRRSSIIKQLEKHGCGYHFNLTDKEAKALRDCNGLLSESSVHKRNRESILAKNFVESCATQILEKGRLGLEQLALEIDKVMIFLGP
ncbi:hypothetical protein JEQ12_009731 [Ovis aries]|uniref:Uncharacterized protein n=1 Tax=Ovis aries TaxID=9940 RepID=A0A836AMT9_SHEEP|nr:hypothetical protein JEQ12_009731 [Ovis aries]